MGPSGAVEFCERKVDFVLAHGVCVHPKCQRRVRVTP